MMEIITMEKNYLKMQPNVLNNHSTQIECVKKNSGNCHLLIELSQIIVIPVISEQYVNILSNNFYFFNNRIWT
ncbi:MAG: hypothetical protein M1365_04240, partial [Actinobacteria bacterium]|nr:hypothetical protein [Actinomycetota bacterium]